MKIGLYEMVVLSTTYHAEFCSYVTLVNNMLSKGKGERRKKGRDSTIEAEKEEKCVGLLLLSFIILINCLSFSYCNFHKLFIIIVNRLFIKFPLFVLP